MPIPLEKFVQQLIDLGVSPRDELDRFLPPRGPSRSAEELARELIAAELLSRFQATAIIQGDGATLKLGNCLLIDRLGAGGMGQVYKALHRRMDRLVAIKTLHPQVANDKATIARFERETQVAARLTHENIVRAYDAGYERGVHFLVMEFVDGQDLSTVVKGGRQLSPAQALDCIAQAAKGLAHAHDAGIIHRDIKPANLLLDRAGIIKVLDLGLARVHQPDHVPPQLELTNTGVVMGTIDYMAPEQALNMKHADARSDVYSLGCTLHFLLRGRALYEGATVMERLIAHREQAPPSLESLASDLPPGLNALFNRMVAKRPDDRYQTMHEVVAALHACGGQDAVASKTIRLAPVPALAPPESTVAGPAAPREAKSTAAVALKVGATRAFDSETIATKSAAAPPELSPSIREAALRRPLGVWWLLGALAAAVLLFVWRGLGTSDKAPSSAAAGSGGQAIAPPAAIASGAPLAAKLKPFVILRDGQQVAEHGDLAAAFERLGPKDTIRIAANGPFAWTAPERIDKPLTLEAAAGYRPLFGVARTIRVARQPVSISGCDFVVGVVGGGPMLAGDGDEWTLSRCRLWGAPSLDFRGQRLRLQACLFSGSLSAPGSLITLAAPARLELEHCCLAGNCLAAVESPGCDIRLTDNTCYLASLIDYRGGNFGVEPARIEAARNVLRLSRGARGDLLPGDAAAAYRWRGRENLVATAPPVSTAAATPAAAKDWASADEAGLRVASNLRFEVDRLVGLDARELMSELEPRLRDARARPGMTELGPDLSLVGPGDAYVRALAAEGRPVAAADLRPAALAGGPFMLVRARVALGGYASLGDALDAAISDDTIEIRGDGPFAGACPNGVNRRLSIVAAPGYLPTFNKAIAAEGSDRLIIEGLRLVRAAGANQPRARLDSARYNKSDAAIYDTPGSFLRVANSAIEDDYLGGWMRGDGGQPAEVVNCLIDKASPSPIAGEKVIVRNCVLRLLLARSVSPAVGEPARIELDRCALWRPGPPPPDTVAEATIWSSNVNLLARRSWFYSGLPILIPTKMNSWNGSRNLYAASAFTRGVALAIDLPDDDIHRDVESLIAPPPLADPRNRRLLPDSAGAGAGPDGNDLGADVDRILAPARSPR